MSDYEIRIVNGRLLVNGSPVRDFLDGVERSYTTATDLSVDRELYRVLSLAFRAGGKAERWDVGGRSAEIEGLPPGVRFVGDARRIASDRDSRRG